MFLALRSAPASSRRPVISGSINNEEDRWRGLWRWGRGEGRLQEFYIYLEYNCFLHLCNIRGKREGEERRGGEEEREEREERDV